MRTALADRPVLVRADDVLEDFGRGLRALGLDWPAPLRLTTAGMNATEVMAWRGDLNPKSGSPRVPVTPDGHYLGQAPLAKK